MQILSPIKRKANFSLAKYITLLSVVARLFSDYSKQVGGYFLRIRLKLWKKCWLYIFSCVKINVFRSFYAFRLEMHVRCDNQYKTGADRGNILGQPMLFEYMGICVLIPAHESELFMY